MSQYWRKAALQLRRLFGFVRERRDQQRPLKLRSFSKGPMMIDLEDKDSVQALLDEEDFK